MLPPISHQLGCQFFKKINLSNLQRTLDQEIIGVKNLRQIVPDCCWHDEFMAHYLIVNLSSQPLIHPSTFNQIGRR